MNRAEHEIRYAQASARDALQNTREVMAKALAELDRYIERYEQADSLTGKANVLNWTINHLTVYIPCNIRLDLIAKAQAELACAGTAR